MKSLDTKVKQIEDILKEITHVDKVYLDKKTNHLIFITNKGFKFNLRIRS